MASRADILRSSGPLLHYRTWQGVFAGSRLSGTIAFVVVQTLLLVVLFALSAPDLHDSTLAGWCRLLLGAVFLGLWALVVYSRAWPIARLSLLLLLRRRLFWAVYALGLVSFLLFFFGQYLMSWAVTQLGEQSVRVGGFGRANPAELVRVFRDVLKLNGSAETFRSFFQLEVYGVMIVLALAGSILIGNDLRFGSLSFYLSRPISSWDYLLGKGLAVAAFINLMTTIPALILFVQYGLLESWDYFLTSGHLMVGIIGYGLSLTVVLTTLLLATAVWVQRTVPLIMVWTSLFIFCPLLSRALVDALRLDPRWRLIDLWNDLYLVGSRLLQVDLSRTQPDWQEAALVLTGVCVLCLSYLILRIRAVEIVK